jgi:hypothetical protein
MVIDDFDIGRTLLGPGKTDAPLVIDADRMLAAPVSGERFEPVRRRGAQIAKITRLMQHIELSQCLLLDAAETFHMRARPEALCRTAAKRSDHAFI